MMMMKLMIMMTMIMMMMLMVMMMMMIIWIGNCTDGADKLLQVVHCDKNLYSPEGEATSAIIQVLIKKMLIQEKVKASLSRTLLITTTLGQFIFLRFVYN